MTTLRLIGLSFLLLLAGCRTDIPDGPWELLWTEDFDGAEGDLPDPARWTADVGGWGWGNNELQYYTDRSENVKLSGDGRLLITAKREQYEGNEWTSARIKTEGLEDIEYGWFGARVKLPAGRGIWPAFWMLGNDFEQVGWPDCGEIDILELRGSAPADLNGTVHGPGFSGGQGLGGSVRADASLADDFHIFNVVWEEERIWWFLDDVLFHTFSADEVPEYGRWVFDHPFFGILNVAVGGGYPLPPDSTTPDEVTMEVDWVRAFAAAGE
jgi:beta-glucanase (GH16 family)